MRTTPLPLHSDRTLADLATTQAGASRVFHRHGLDFCCGGQVSLAEACAEAELDAQTILDELRVESDRADLFATWDQLTLEEIVDHILTCYHEPHREELPRLAAMARKVESVHRDKDACPHGLADFLAEMSADLELHMQKEEQVLFPMLRSGRGRTATLPIQVMENEHRDHGRNLERLRELTHGYDAPSEACGTWIALYLGLHELERDLMEHIHIENNVLFPRALRALEPLVMHNDRKLWVSLVLVVSGTFMILGFFGREIYRQAPPIPDRVVDESGAELFTSEDILDGQQVWQSIGGQQVGSVWGHGAYQAPDWSADWLHREALAMRENWSVDEYGEAFEDLDADTQGMLSARLQREMRTNRFDEASGTLVITNARRVAMNETAQHYTMLFGGDDDLSSLREDYALHDDAVTDPARLEALNAFFFWTSWACVTERPGESFTYTNNWPHEPLVGNQPTAANIVWSVLSIVLLLAGAAGLVWFHESRRREEPVSDVPKRDPLGSMQLTPSMRAVTKYLVVVIALFVVQVLLGALTAHYTVEGDSFFGLPLHEYLPYAITRTWHIQTAIFWIATAFLGTGLFIAPLIGGHEPRFQRLGVNVLFGALLLVVGGSLVGEYLSVHQLLGLDAGFWFGHQGYEYVDLGRAWQIALFVGLLLWLTLMLRAIWPALHRKEEGRGTIALFTASVVAIGSLYGAGLFYGARSHLSVAEYWRWWVVHLWVEGFFEVFATGVLALLFTRFGLVKARNAKRAFIASTTIFLLGGIPGTFHHLYFSGTPVSVTAVGAMFSALEVVPLVLIGREAYETLRTERAADWMRRYRWPIRFFVGVAFWNLVGAGLFGFLINPPVALYYMQGLNTTPVHAHTALFGVYGLLSLGLVLLMLRKLGSDAPWREGVLSYSFWAMNGGLALMVVLSLLPIGLAQTWASVEHGLWYARSADFLQLPVLETLRWLRIVGDTVFLSGVAALVWFTIGLRTGWSYEGERAAEPRLTPQTQGAVFAESGEGLAKDAGLLG